MLLYDSAVSGNCYKVRLLLNMRGLAFERHAVDVVDRSGRMELLGELNPALEGLVVVVVGTVVVVVAFDGFLGLVAAAGALTEKSVPVSTVTCAPPRTMEGL